MNSINNNMEAENYFKNSKSVEKWDKIGTGRKAGVAIPLFSVYSKNSVGIGEIPDIKGLIKWAKQSGLSIIMLLPLNDMGYDNSPYNALSSFALDPVYISLKELREVNLEPFKKEISALKRKFKAGSSLVNFEVKNAKLKILFNIYNKTYVGGIPKFLDFKKENMHWLKNYALYKALKDFNYGDGWEDWNSGQRDCIEEVISEFESINKKQFDFIYWVQWQLFEQLKNIKKYASDNEVMIIGDIPFLVSRDSADVWANKSYFNLNMASGAPPDMYFANGQKWGMPPYNWEEIEKNNYDYISQKLKYAENFYAMYRIDHFVGLFRLWTIDINSKEERGGLDGYFNPAEEYLWEEHGVKILNAMLNSTDILPCAEDLGVVPECSYKVLREYGVTGMEIQRWSKERSQRYDFYNEDEYRINSISSVSTHDSSLFFQWWLNEVGTIDSELFKRLCGYREITGERYDAIKSELFDNEHPDESRLLWKEEINSVDIFLGKLQLSYEQAWDMAALYLDSFNEKKKFLDYIACDYIGDMRDIDNSIIKSAIRKSMMTNSVFAVNLIQDYLSLDESCFKYFRERPSRINFPGKINETNWRTILPVSIEKLTFLAANDVIKNMISESKRD
jgi:4-alpha-glucanotransferase